MGAVLSATVFTLVDNAGNPRTEMWATWEFRENYATGGVVADLTTYFRRVENIILNPIVASGAPRYIPAINDVDYPGNAGSGRIQLFGIASGGVNASGVAIRIPSGQILLFSGSMSSSTAASLLVSGMIYGAMQLPERAFQELTDATAVSGVRVRMLALGY